MLIVLMNHVTQPQQQGLVGWWVGGWVGGWGWGGGAGAHRFACRESGKSISHHSAVAAHRVMEINVCVSV